jgi:hypothetical protein
MLQNDMAIGFSEVNHSPVSFHTWAPMTDGRLLAPPPKTVKRTS